MFLLEKKVLFSALGGFVLGKAGNMIFGSDTAKKAYLKAATGGMILKDYILEQAEIIQAEASDIAADARVEADKYQAKKDAAFAAKMNPEPVFEDTSDSEDDNIVE